MGVDALGPTVIKVLEAEYEFPRGSRCRTLGPPALTSPLPGGVRAPIVVDTVRSGGAPGEVRLYRRDEILKNPPQPRLHPRPRLKEALPDRGVLGKRPPRGATLGVIPAGAGTGVGLSPSVQGAVRSAAAAVVKGARRLGVAPTARPVPDPRDSGGSVATGHGWVCER